MAVVAPTAGHAWRLAGGSEAEGAAPEGQWPPSLQEGEARDSCQHLGAVPPAFIYYAPCSSSAPLLSVRGCNPAPDLPSAGPLPRVTAHAPCEPPPGAARAGQDAVPPPLWKRVCSFCSRSHRRSPCDPAIINAGSLPECNGSRGTTLKVSTTVHGGIIHNGPHIGNRPTGPSAAERITGDVAHVYTVGQEGTERRSARQCGCGPHR